MYAKPTITRASDRSVMVRFGSAISLDVQRRVWATAEALRARGILNVHPGYSSLLISFDPMLITYSEVESLVDYYALERIALLERDPAVITIPVCYGGEFGPDLEEVAAAAEMSAGDVIGLHSQPEYKVYFLGFMPGFPYLGELPPDLAMPRLAVPRTRVAAGSVGIGGHQTGIYPAASPGGWRIVGRTPLRLFDLTSDDPTLLHMGDSVRFVPIPAEEFHRYATS